MSGLRARGARPGPGRILPLFAALLIALPGPARGEEERLEYGVWLEAAFDETGAVVDTHAWSGQPDPLVRLADREVRKQRLAPAQGAGPGRRIERFAVTFTMVDAGDGDLVVESVATTRSTPKPVDLREPPYPRNELVRGREGWVDVRLRVTEDGRTDDVKVLGSDPPVRFDAAAAETVRAWRFEPQVLPGTLVEPVYEQRIEFKVTPG